MRNNGFMLFDTETKVCEKSGRPKSISITNWRIGTALGFSNLGTQAQMAADIPIQAITEKIKVIAAKYYLQPYLLAQDRCGQWRLWSVLKPEDVVPRNPNLINLVLRQQENTAVFDMALEFYETKRGGCCHG